MWRRSLYFVLVFAITLHSQTAQTPDSANPTFKSKVQLTLVDVVVTDGKGHPITGLQKDDFEIFEATDLIGKGEKQTIASFEEHKGAPTRIEPLPPPAPHFYTNAPPVASADSVSVLLLDALNTASEDQAAVRRQMIEYLKKIDPGPRLAIFTLGSRLRIVEGFSSDPRALIEALGHKNWGGMPQASTPVETAAEADANQKVQQIMIDGGATIGAIQSLQGFLSERTSTEQVSRVSVTMEALRQLCQYLSGFPGRKNLIWFSGSFPSIGLAGSSPSIHSTSGASPSVSTASGSSPTVTLNLEPRLERELKDTVNLLAAAQVAVYPVAAQGLEMEPLFQANQLVPRAGQGQPVPSSNPEEMITSGTNQHLDQASTARAVNTGAADEIASDTGGKAFYNDNGLKGALADAIANGSHYYSLSYAPTDKRMLGRYRRIEVKLREGHYKLAYRRGYFEEDSFQIGHRQPPSAAYPLENLLRRGLQDATQIVFNLRVLRTNSRPAAAPAIAGDNKKLREPLIRFSADFVVPLDNLDFQITDDGVRHGNLELALMAYDHNGDPLNWLFRTITTSLKPEVYPAVEKNGAVFHQEIDLPEGENYLRAGIYDLQSNQAGTLEIPLREVTSADVPSTTPQKPAAVAPSAAPLSSSSQAKPVGNEPASPGPNETISVLSAATTASVETSTSVTHDGTNHTPAPLPLAAASANTPPPASTVSPGSTSPGTPALAAAKELESVDIPKYCSDLGGKEGKSSSLTAVCEFVLNLRKKLPNLICDRETKRYWTTGRDEEVAGHHGPKTEIDDEQHADVVTAHVSYRDGREYYSDLRVDGQPSSANAPELSQWWAQAGSWSHGEFATMLAGIFAPSSLAQFHYSGETKLHSIPAFVFDFKVAVQNNRLYFLQSDNKIWFPAYGGRIWVDARTASLLRLERETGYMRDDPITRVKTEIEYSNLPLGDGTSMVLPINSNDLICAPPLHEIGNSENCARSTTRFMHWHKFRATTNVVTSPAN